MMIDLPEWLVKYVSELRCPDCGLSVKRDNITAVGIKKTWDMKGHKRECLPYIFIEHTCPKCKNAYNFEMSPCSVKNFVYEMMGFYGLFNKTSAEVMRKLGIENETMGDEDMSRILDLESEKDKKDYDKLMKKKHSRSRISEEEIRSFKEEIDKAKTWHDTMEIMGIADQDYDKYTSE